MTGEIKKILYHAQISYRTPGGHERWFIQTMVPATSLEDLQAEMHYRLRQEIKMKDRRVAEITGGFSAVVAIPKLRRKKRA